MTTLAQGAATLDDLLKVEGKAELIAGRIVHFMASGELPSSVAFEIAISLREYAKRERRGKAYADRSHRLCAPRSVTRQWSRILLSGRIVL